MKKIYIQIILVFFISGMGSTLVQGQQLVNENFNFSGALTANGWMAHSGAGTNPVSTTTGLTYAGLSGSGIGNAALVDNAGGEDVNRTFTPQNTDGQNIYVSLLVNVTDAATDKTGDYIFHLGDGGGASFTLFAARLYVKITASAVNFGISNTSTATYGTTNFAKNTTYLLIIKYSISTTGNDPVSLWVFPSGVPATEATAGVPQVSNTGTSGQNTISGVALRQGSSANSVQTVVDAIKIGLTWADVTPSSTVPPSLTVTGTINDFGNVFIGSSSPSQSYMLSGANLTGAPGVITVTASNANFQVSNNNVTFGTTTTIPYTSATLSPTQVWVRFTPQTSGPLTGTISNTGGGVSTAVTISVNGTGVVPITPVLGAGALTGFGSVCVNATAGPNNFTISGTNLTAGNITVGPLAGFSFSTSSGGIYTASLTLPQTGGTYSQQVFVKFTPTASQSYNGNISVAGGGAASINVAATGSGGNTAPAVTSNPATLITTTTATLNGVITDVGCSAISSYGFEYSLSNGFPNGSGMVVIASNNTSGNYSAGISGLLPASTYYFIAFAINSGGTSYSIQRSFTTLAPVIASTPLTAFGSICLNTTSAANSFTLSSTGLSTSNIVVGPLAGYSFSTSATGSFTPTLSITQPGGVFNQVVYVKFTPTSEQSYNGNIPVSGGGATTISVGASGSGVNSPAIVNTGTATAPTPNSVTLSGTTTGNGCSSVTSQGIEYSSINNFGAGQGIKVPATNLTAGNFSVTLSGLVQNTTYYFRAYATNGGGTAYGTLQSFTTASIPPGLVIYGSPALRGGNLHVSLDNLTPGHYTMKVVNIAGQVVFQRDVILQVNFIDDNFTLPYRLMTGLYILRIENTANFKVSKPFMVR
ncbi:MAG: T9SS type A sorting domain-containing protein [Ferruginibacter sp.]